jgi:ornithine decarboxylase
MTTTVEYRAAPAAVGQYYEQATIASSAATHVAPGQPVSTLLRKLDSHPGFSFTSQALPTPVSSPPLSATKELQRQAVATSSTVPVLDVPVDDLIREQIERANMTGEEDAFFVGDLSAVYEAVQTWRSSPLGDRVEIFYAVKCNPSPAVLHLLSLLGTSFDCASISEINMVLALPCAPSPDRIIFANPCKPASFIRSAERLGVEMMTFDNADELHKIARLHPDAKLVLRILTDDSKSLCRLGLKYGAPLDTCPGLLSLARSLGLSVIGVSFHVGSGCKDPDQFRDAVWRAKRVFDMGKAQGYDFRFLDVGGGFEGAGFAEMSRVLSDSLDEHFPRHEGVRVVAEPGRFMVSTAFTLATSIIARRRALTGPSGHGPAPVGAVAHIEQAAAAMACTAEGEHGHPGHTAGKEEVEGADVMYYINDGVYGSFNCILYDHQIVHPYPLTLSHAHPSPISSCIPRHPGPPTPPNVNLPTDLPVMMGYATTERASVWGPTCDSIDCVRDVVDLPKGLEVGDWLGWGEMGAYTMCAASNFNGFAQSSVHYTTGGTSSRSSRAVRGLLDGFEAGVVAAGLDE